MDSQTEASGEQLVDALFKISNVTNGNLNKEAIKCIAELMELGIEPESLVEVIESLQWLSGGVNGIN